MTIETWKAEFYPTEADACPAEKAVEHSLQKWRGMRPEALAAHGLRVTGAGHLADVSTKFRINSDSCALCASFSDEEAGWGNECKECPLSIARGGVACDSEAPDEEISPWEAWADHENPEPMIAALEKAGGAS